MAKVITWKLREKFFHFLLRMKLLPYYDVFFSRNYFKLSWFVSHLPFHRKNGESHKTCDVTISSLVDVDMRKSVKLQHSTQKTTTTKTYKKNTEASWQRAIVRVRLHLRKKHNFFGVALSHLPFLCTLCCDYFVETNELTSFFFSASKDLTFKNLLTTYLLKCVKPWNEKKMMKYMCGPLISHTCILWPSSYFHHNFLFSVLKETHFFFLLCAKSSSNQKIKSNFLFSVAYIIMKNRNRRQMFEIWTSNPSMIFKLKEKMRQTDKTHGKMKWKTFLLKCRTKLCRMRNWDRMFDVIRISEATHTHSIYI